MKLYQTSCTVKLETGAVQSWPMGILGGFSQSLWLPMAFISLKKRGENVHWSWPVVILVLAGHGRGVDTKVAAAAAAAAVGWRLEKWTSGFPHQNWKLSVHFDLDLTLMSPSGDTSAVCLRLADDMGFWRQMEETGQEIFSWSVWGKDRGEEPYTAR